MASLFAVIARKLATASTTKPINTKRINDRLRGGRKCILRIGRDGTTGTVAVYGANLPSPFRGNVKPSGNVVPEGAYTQENSQVFRGDGATLAFQTVIPYAAFSNYNWLLDIHKVDRYPVAAASWTVSSGTGGNALITWATETFSGDGSTTVFTMAARWDMYSPPIGTDNPANSPTGYVNPIVSVGGVVKTLGTDYTLTQSTVNADGLTYDTTIVVTFTVAPANASNNITIALPPASGVDFAVMFGTPTAIVAAIANPDRQLEVFSFDRLWAVGASSPSSTDIFMDPGSN